MSLSGPTESTGMKVTSYQSINRAAYNALAENYRARRESDRKKDQLLIEPFVRLLRRHFVGETINVLDLGCGNGLNLSMFAAEGFEVTGIDISERMLEVARETCPSAKLIHDDFLAHPFPTNSFNGVFAKAIIHLFPKPDAIRVLSKIHTLLKTGGIFYVTTTIEPNPFEGLREKSDYGGNISRYRKVWAQEELTNAVLNTNFKIAETNYNQEHERGKKWFNIWAFKTPRPNVI